MAEQSWEQLSAASSAGESLPPRDEWGHLSAASDGSESVPPGEPWGFLSEPGPEPMSGSGDSTDEVAPADASPLAIAAADGPDAEIPEPDVHGHGITAPSISRTPRHAEAHRLAIPIVMAVEAHVDAHGRAEFVGGAADSAAVADSGPKDSNDAEEAPSEGALVMLPANNLEALAVYGPLDPLQTVASRSPLAFMGLAVAAERAALLFRHLQQQGAAGALFDQHMRDTVLDHFLRTKASVISSAAEAALLGTGAHAVAKCRRLAAALSWMMQGRDCCRMLSQVSNEVVANGGKCVLFTEKYKADESCFSFKVSDEESAGAGPHDAIAQVGALPILGSVAQQKSPTKMLQSAREVSALFRLSDGRFVSITCDLAMPLTIMRSTQCQYYYVCYKRLQLPWRECLPPFQRRQVLLTTDADGAVAACAKGLAKEDPDAAFWHQLCEIHKLSNMTEDVMSGLEAQHFVTALISLSLSLQSANAMKEFRDALRLVLSERLEFRRRRPSRKNLSHHASVLALCLPDDSRTSMLRCEVVCSLLNGDWLLEQVVQHDCPGCCASRDACLSKMVGLLVAVLARSAPPTWPRHRWKGAIEAVNWALLLSAAHGLLKVTYLVWASSQRGGGKLLSTFGLRTRGCPAPDLAGAHDATPFDADPPAHNDAPVGEGVSSNAFVPAALDARGGEESLGLGAGHGADNIEAMRLAMSNYRATASHWLGVQDPLGWLMVVRLVLGPLDMAMNAYFRQAGQLWQARQAAGEAAAAAAEVRSRAFRPCLAFDGALLEPALQECKKLATSPEAWDLLPARFRTCTMRAHATLMLSQSACALFELRAAHLRYPFKMFALLGPNPAEAAEDILRDSVCVLDAWSREFLKCYEPLGLTSEECLEDLRQTAQLVELEIASVEAGHASIRRLQHVLSCQTHAEHAIDASSEWSLRKLRGQQRSFAGLLAKVPQATTQRPESKPPSAARHGRGGAWRAFVREASLGTTGRPDLARLAEQYRNLSAEQKEALKVIGAAATEAGRQPGMAARSAFGLSTRDQKRLQRKRAIAALVERESAAGAVAEVPELPPHSRRRLALTAASAATATALAIPPAASSSGDFSRLSELKQQGLLEKRTAQAIVAQQAMALSQYQAGAGAERLQDAARSSATLRLRQQEYEPLPGATCINLRWRSDQVADRAKSALSLNGRSHVAKVFFPAVSAAWEKLHTAVEGDPELRKRLVGMPSAQTACHTAGMCLCNGDGPMLRKFASSLDKVVSPLFPPHTGSRERLARGHIVLLFMGQTQELIGALEAREAGPRSGAASSTPRPPEVRAAHIARHSLSPWRSTYEEVTGSFAVGAECVAPGELKVRMERTFLEQFPFLRQFDLGLRWSVAPYEVVLAERMVGNFLPAALDVRLLPGAEAAGSVFWDPFRKKSLRKAKADPWACVGAASSGSSSANEDPQATDEDRGPPESAEEPMEAPDFDNEPPFADPASPWGGLGSEGDELDEFGITWSDIDAMGEGDDEDELAELVAAELGPGGAPPVADAAAADDDESSSSSSSSSDNSSSGSTKSSSRSEEPGDRGAGNRSTHPYVVVNGYTKLILFRQGSRQEIVGVCARPGHGDCRLTRTMLGSKRRGAAFRPGQGRPLGFAMAWAEAPFDCAKDAHSSKHYSPSLEARQAGRASLADVDGAVVLFAAERPRRDGEPSEPEKFA